MSFQSMAEAGIGHFHPSSQDTYTLFDPNYGEVTWNSELHYRQEFAALFSNVRNAVYQGELNGVSVVVRLGKPFGGEGDAGKPCGTAVLPAIAPKEHRRDSNGMAVPA